MKRKKYLVLKKYLASDLLCGHGEQGGDAEGDPGGDSVGVQPEADPGDDDEHAAGHVDGQQVVGELPLKGEVHGEAAVLACRTICCPDLFYGFPVYFQGFMFFLQQRAGRWTRTRCVWGLVQT